jgi:hypothetical protein
MLSITEVILKLVVDKWMSMEHQGNNTDGKTKVLREETVPMPLCLPQIPLWLAWDWTWASAVWDLWQSEWPQMILLN